MADSFLYNGHELPELLEPRKKYNFIYSTSKGVIFWFTCEKPFIAVYVNDTLSHGPHDGYICKTASSCNYSYYELKNNNWKLVGNYTGKPSACFGGYGHIPYWADHDILYENSENIYLKGSSPIRKKYFSKDFLKIFLTGYANGIGAIPLIFKTPTRYSYNGLELPVFPEVDPAQYPYVALTGISEDAALFASCYRLTFFDKKPLVKIEKAEDEEYCTRGFVPDTESFSFKRFINSPDKGITIINKWYPDWQKSEGVVETGKILEDVLIGEEYEGAPLIDWSNFNCYDVNKQLICVGTDPKPILKDSIWR